VTEESRVEAYLYRQIPLSCSMGVRVIRVSDAEVELEIPLEPNINHRRTVFGGSAAAAATLAAWAVLWHRLKEHPRRPELVIQANRMQYLLPIYGAFTARTLPVDNAAWNRFVSAIERKGRARIEVSSSLEFRGHRCGLFSGTFVALVEDCEASANQ
jgi:thioesterase domain-containing protein